MKEHPLLSIIITSYTMERFKDICDLFDSIASQTLLTQPRSPKSYVLSPRSEGSDIGRRTSDMGHLIEVIFALEGTARGRNFKLRTMPGISSRSVKGRA